MSRSARVIMEGNVKVPRAQFSNLLDARTGRSQCSSRSSDGSRISLPKRWQIRRRFAHLALGSLPS